MKKQFYKRNSTNLFRLGGLTLFLSATAAQGQITQPFQGVYEQEIALRQTPEAANYLPKHNLGPVKMPPVPSDAKLNTEKNDPPRKPFPKPMRTEVSDLHQPGLIVLKIVEDSGALMRNGKFQGKDARLLDDLNRLLTHAGIKKIKRVYSNQTEDEITAQYKHAEGFGSKTLADPNLFFEIQLTDHDKKAHATLIDQLNGLDIVEIAYPQPVSMPTSIDLSANQVYLYPSSTQYPNYLGINAKHAWENKNIRGEGVRLLDVGMGWDLEHEDLQLPSSIVFGTMSNDTKDVHHGTSTIGVIAARHNGFGVSGIAPNVDLRLVSLKTMGYAGAITMADNNSRYGDIISYEHGIGDSAKIPNTDIIRNFSLPIEYTPLEFNAIRTATNNGKIFVETAGNGDTISLTGIVLEEYFPLSKSFKRNSPDFTDSGAIMVGGGYYNPFRGYYGTPTKSTNGGSRVDLQGHGESVTTTGASQGTIDYDTIKHDQYTDTFNGTSSAALIVSGAAALVQSYFKKTFKHSESQPPESLEMRALNSVEMRALLKNTGHPQPAFTGTENRHIGPLPDVAAALTAKPISPTIFANGKADRISIPVGGNLNITINLDAGFFSDLPVDWWYLVNWNGTWYYNTCSGSTCKWDVSAARWFASNLFNVSNYTVYSSPMNYKGTYTFHFGVDTKQDGAMINLDSSLQESLYWKSVIVTVE